MQYLDDRRSSTFLCIIVYIRAIYTYLTTVMCQRLARKASRVLRNSFTDVSRLCFHLHPSRTKITALFGKFITLLFFVRYNSFEEKQNIYNTKIINNINILLTFVNNKVNFLPTTIF